MPKEPAVGENVTIKASAENIGKGGGTYLASLTINGKVVETRDVPLTAGAKQDITFKILADTPGTNIIKLGELEETLRILKPAKFRATRLEVSPKVAKIGENVTVNIDLENEGEARGTRSLSLILGGNVTATKDVALSGGSKQSVSFTVSQNLTGIHNIEVEGLKGTVRVIDYARPPTGTYLLGKASASDTASGSDTLYVVNYSDFDAVVILTTALAPKTPIVAVYVRAQGGYSIFVTRYDRYNSYHYVYYTLGNSWDNYTQEFAEARELMWLPEKMNLGAYQWTLRLAKGAEGKDIKPLKEEEFPKLR